MKDLSDQVLVALSERASGLSAAMALMDKERAAMTEEHASIMKILGRSKNSSPAAADPAKPTRAASILEGAAAIDNLTVGILDTLRASPEPMNPTPIARKLMAAGFSDDSKTPLATRINNQLIRLKKRGAVERLATGYRAKSMN